MKNGTSFTERELDIMSILWREGSGTVAEVKDELDSNVGYTTVLKMLPERISDMVWGLLEEVAFQAISLWTQFLTGGKKEV